MTSDTLALLRQLRLRYKAGTQGKIIQALFALALVSTRCCDVVLRLSEGVDVTLRRSEGDKCAVEVKTTERPVVAISARNIRALAQATRDGYVPVLAALRMEVLGGWLLARVPLNEMRPGNLSVETLRAYRQREWEDLIDAAFDGIVKEHFEGVSANGVGYLIQVLRQKGAEVQAEG